MRRLHRERPGCRSPSDLLPNVPPQTRPHSPDLKPHLNPEVYHPGSLTNGILPTPSPTSNANLHSIDPGLTTLRPTHEKPGLWPGFLIPHPASETPCTSTTAPPNTSAVTSSPTAVAAAALRSAGETSATTTTPAGVPVPVSRRSAPPRTAKASTFDLPSPADLAERSGVQLALALILHKIANNEIDSRRAGLLLYGLGIASSNLKQDRAAKPNPTLPVEEIIEHETDGLLAPETEYDEAESDTAGPFERGNRLLAKLAVRLEALPDREDFQEPATVPRIQARAQESTQKGNTPPLLCRRSQFRDHRNRKAQLSPGSLQRRSTSQVQPNSSGWKTLNRKYGTPTLSS